MLLNIVLNFFFEFLGGLCSLCENDRCLNNLTSDLIRSGGNTTLENVRQLHNNAFDFKGTDAVTGGFDNVIGAADVPIEAVLIAPSNVARVVVAVPRRSFLRRGSSP